MSRKTRRSSSLRQAEEQDPLSVIVNMFDVAMVFAVSLMVAMVMHMNLTEFLGKESFSIVKNPGKENMEIITKEGGKVQRYTPSKEQTKHSGKQGRKVGIAYELENGEIIYVPE